MTTFTIDTDNNITAHGTPEEAAATTATPLDSFASQQELGESVKLNPAQPLQPKAARKAKGGAQSAKGGTTKGKASK
jgi:hypothetical protein